MIFTERATGDLIFSSFFFFLFPFSFFFGLFIFSTFQSFSAWLYFKSNAQESSSRFHSFFPSRIQFLSCQLTFHVHWPLSWRNLIVESFSFLKLQAVHGSRSSCCNKRSTWWTMSLFWYRHVMVVYPLVCYYDSTGVIYGCLNVLTNRASSRSASVIVPENSYQGQIRSKSKLLSHI